MFPDEYHQRADLGIAQRVLHGRHPAFNRAIADDAKQTVVITVAEVPLIIEQAGCLATPQIGAMTIGAVFFVQRRHLASLTQGRAGEGTQTQHRNQNADLGNGAAKADERSGSHWWVIRTMTGVQRCQGSSEPIPPTDSGEPTVSNLDQENQRNQRYCRDNPSIRSVWPGVKRSMQWSSL